MMTKVLRWAMISSALLLLAPLAADAEDNFYTVWVRGSPTVKPSGIKDYGWARGTHQFLNTVQSSTGEINIVHKVTQDGHVYKHVKIRLQFTPPPKQLRVGDEFTMNVAGDIKRLDNNQPYAEAAWVRVLAESLALDQRYKLAAGTPSLFWQLKTKLQRAPRGAFDVAASMGPGIVTWTYRPQKVAARAGERGGVVGKVIRTVGTIEQRRPGDRGWSPVAVGTPIRAGMTIRTRGMASAWVAWTRPGQDGDMATNFVGNDLTVRIEDNARPERPGMILIGGFIRAIQRRIRGTHGAHVWRIQAGDIWFTPEGTDYVLAYDRASRTVACYVNEGRVRLQAPGGRSLLLGAGQEVTAARGVPGAPRRMRSGQWAGLTKNLQPVGTSTIGIPPRPPGAVLFRPEPVMLRFFESGKGTLAANRRVYRTRFAARTTRYVNWELSLAYAPPSRKQRFDIVAIWYRANGTQLTRQTMNAWVDPGWKDSIHAYGWGAVNAGIWGPGWYRVDLHIGASKVASASFEITR